MGVCGGVCVCSVKEGWVGVLTAVVEEVLQYLSKSTSNQ